MPSLPSSRCLKNRTEWSSGIATQTAMLPESPTPTARCYNIAGITNERGNVLGLMPHPERCCDNLLGGEDGKFIFQSMIDALTGASLAGVSR